MSQNSCRNSSFVLIKKKKKHTKKTPFSEIFKTEGRYSFTGKVKTFFPDLKKKNMVGQFWTKNFFWGGGT